MQYEPDLIRDVLNMLTNHGLQVISVDIQKGEILVRIPEA